MSSSSTARAQPSWQGRRLRNNQLWQDVVHSPHFSLLNQGVCYGLKGKYGMLSYAKERAWSIVSILLPLISNHRSFAIGISSSSS
eukprot:scaffold338_cov361-Pavlova_lutheri.AAC.23